MPRAAYAHMRTPWTMQDIGMSSLIVWAAGAHPSKDTLWSTDNNKTSVPGCQWTPDHEAPAAEL